MQPPLAGCAFRDDPDLVRWRSVGFVIDEDQM
jgi:hypothetical protein